MLERINKHSRSILKYFTIASYILSILIYEIFICNGERTGIYNFSIYRIVMYTIFLIVTFKYIDRFIIQAINTMQSKFKKISLSIYIPIAIMLIIYIMIRWTSVYKIAILLIALLMGLIFIIYVSADYIKNTILIICTFGIICTIATDFHHTLDEKRHILSAINISEGNIDYKNNPLNEKNFYEIKMNCDIDEFAKQYSQRYEPKLTDNWEDDDSETPLISSLPADYNFIIYLPSAIGITVAKVLGGSVADTYISARLFNLITYAIMISFALKMLPYKHKIFYIIFTFPISIVLAATCSIDGLCIGLIGMFIAYCLKLSEENYENIKVKQIITLIILFAGCLLAKDLSYCAMILLVLILPISKILKNNKKKLPLILTIIAISIIIAGILMLSKFTSTTSGGGDPRGGATSVSGQIGFLINSPFNAIKVGFTHIMNSLLNYNWGTYLNNSCFFGKYSAQIFFLQLIFIIYVSCTDNSHKIKTRTTIVSILTFLAVFASTSLMLYLTFTPVGQIEIAGYQPRYILPILPLVLMLINNNRYIGKTSKEEEKNTDISIALMSGFFIMIDIICLIYVI